MGDEAGESLKRFEILVFDSGAKRFVNLVVSRNVDPVDGVHTIRSSSFRPRLLFEAMKPLLAPCAEVLTCCEQGIT
jgi:hypothetical protein